VRPLVPCIYTQKQKQSNRTLLGFLFSSKIKNGLVSDTQRLLNDEWVKMSVFLLDMLRMGPLAEHAMAKTPVLSHGLKQKKNPCMRTTELTHVIALSKADLSSLRPTQIMSESLVSFFFYGRGLFWRRWHFGPVYLFLFLFFLSFSFQAAHERALSSSLKSGPELLDVESELMFCLLIYVFFLYFFFSRRKKNGLSSSLKSGRELKRCPRMRTTQN